MTVTIIITFVGTTHHAERALHAHRTCIRCESELQLPPRTGAWPPCAAPRGRQAQHPQRLLHLWHLSSAASSFWAKLGLRFLHISLIFLHIGPGKCLALCLHIVVEPSHTAQGLLQSRLPRVLPPANS